MQPAIVSLLLNLLLAPVTTASQQQSKTSAGVAALPQADGVYYRQSAAKWIQLTQARVADSKIRGMETYLQTDGLTGLNMNFVYPGAHAAIQIFEKRPTFFVRGIGTGAEALIVQLTCKKDSRAVSTTSLNAARENNAGFDKKDIYRVVVVLSLDGGFSATPEENLKPGEYLLTFGSANTGYDFGISSAKR